MTTRSYSRYLERLGLKVREGQEPELSPVVQPVQVVADDRDLVSPVLGVTGVIGARVSASGTNEHPYFRIVARSPTKIVPMVSLDTVDGVAFQRGSPANGVNGPFTPFFIMGDPSQVPTNIYQYGSTPAPASVMFPFSFVRAEPLPETWLQAGETYAFVGDSINRFMGIYIRFTEYPTDKAQ